MDASHLSIQFNHSGDEICQPGHSFGPAVRDHCLIHFIASGTGIFQKGNFQWKLDTGDAFVIFPDEVTYYEASKDNPWHYLYLGFSGTQASELLAAAGVTPDHPVIHVPAASGVLPLLRDINALHTYTLTNELSRHGLLYLLLSRLTDCLTRGMGRPVSASGALYVEKSLAYIRKNYHRDIRVTDIADYIGISRKYLCRLFTLHAGLSPQQALMDHRIRTASALLTSTDLPVAEVAHSVGYPDIFLFSRQFKKHTGISPRAYRQRG